MTVATETLTIRLPTAAAHRLRRVAEVARRPVDEVVAETLRTSLPPLLEDVPPAFRSDLAALETFSTVALWQQMRAELSPEQVHRYDMLLETNAAGALNWLSCRRCNEHKGIQTEALDPETGSSVSLFDPRRQTWPAHFKWSGDGTRILGLTPCGRAPVSALQLNDADIVAARQLWVAVGWHPPQE